MREVKRSALIAESPARMYALINDIERYPAFVPGCVAARVVEPVARVVQRRLQPAAA